MVRNERDKVTVRLIKKNMEQEWFLELWERIKARTRYKVNYDSEKLIEAAAAQVKDMPAIDSPKLAVIRSEFDILQEGVAVKETGIRTHEINGVRPILPDFIAQVQARTALSKSTVARILLASGRLGDALKNPQVFIDSVSQIINEAKRELLVKGIEYLQLDGYYYDQRRFESDDAKEYFDNTVLPVSKQDKTLFSHIVIDSESTPEKEFMQACEDNEDVLFYMKLPSWFKIDTPVGSYTPDWALVYKNAKTLYFVAETKGATDLALLRPLERLKIECGKKHFKIFERVEFKVVKDFSQLLI